MEGRLWLQRSRRGVDSFTLDLAGLQVEVPHVPTNDNPADFFTKPMKNAARFRELRTMVMNDA